MPHLDRLKRQLDFLAEIDKLKGVLRQSSISSGERRENSAEHSWHLAMFAIVLADHADGAIDILRVVKMLLIHDIVEIDAGDHPYHETGLDWDAIAEKERAAADRLFGLLPVGEGAEFRALWEEFEAAETPEARFAKALDRMQPILLNVLTGGGTWIDFAVSESDVLRRCGETISAASPALWRATEALIRGHFAGRAGWDPAAE
jgi:putative hydrolase of HD superfamily